LIDQQYPPWPGAAPSPILDCFYLNAPQPGVGEVIFGAIQLYSFCVANPVERCAPLHRFWRGTRCTLWEVLLKNVRQKVCLFSLLVSNIDSLLLHLGTGNLQEACDLRYATAHNPSYVESLVAYCCCVQSALQENLEDRLTIGDFESLESSKDMSEDTICAAVIIVRNVILLSKSSGFKALCGIHNFFNNVALCMIEKLNWLQIASLKLEWYADIRTNLQMEFSGFVSVYNETNSIQFNIHLSNQICSNFLIFKGASPPWTPQPAGGFTMSRCLYLVPREDT